MAVTGAATTAAADGAAVAVGVSGETTAPPLPLAACTTAAQGVGGCMLPGKHAAAAAAGSLGKLAFVLTAAERLATACRPLLCWLTDARAAASRLTAAAAVRDAGNCRITWLCSWRCASERSWGALEVALEVLIPLTAVGAVCIWAVGGSLVFEPGLRRGPNLDRRLTDGVCTGASAAAVLAAAVCPGVCAGFGARICLLSKSVRH